MCRVPESAWSEEHSHTGKEVKAEMEEIMCVAGQAWEGECSTKNTGETVCIGVCVCLCVFHTHSPLREPGSNNILVVNMPNIQILVSEYHYPIKVTGALWINGSFQDWNKKSTA